MQILSKQTTMFLLALALTASMGSTGYSQNYQSKHSWRGSKIHQHWNGWNNYRHGTSKPQRYGNQYKRYYGNHAFGIQQHRNFNRGSAYYGKQQYFGNRHYQSQKSGSTRHLNAHSYYKKRRTYK